MRIPGPVRPVVVLIAALSAVLPTAAATGASRSAPVSAGHHAQPGALSWHDVPTGTSERFRGLSPVSRRVAWVSGTHGTVLRTTDAGRTWQDVSPGQHNQNAEFRDIEAIDADTAVVLAIGPGRKSRIYRTDDAGQTWTRGFVNTDPAAFYDCMGFWNAKRGVAVSDPVDGKFRVIRTDDGGRSWSVVDPAGMPAALPGEFGFAASGTCLVTAGAQDAWIASGGGATARVFHSTDRGDHWTVADTPVASSDAGGIFSLAVRHRDDLVAVGGDYLSPEQTTHTSAYSLDAGATWAPGGDLGGYRSGSAWLPLPHGVVAVGPTGSDVSFDGGVSWSPVDSGSLDSVQCTRDGACWGSGNLGRVAVLRGLR